MRDGIPVMLSPADLSDPVFGQYRDNYAQIGKDDLDQDILDPTYVNLQAKKLVSYIDTAAPIGKLLDVGAGRGVLARLLLDLYINSLTVCDISVEYLKCYADLDGVRPVLANAENLPFRDEFDVIVCTDVLEHVLNVGSCLISISRALTIGGRAVVRVPFRESLLQYSPLMGCAYRFVHLRSFDESIADVYFKAVGLEVERIDFDGYWIDHPGTFWTKGPVRQKTWQIARRKAGRWIGEPIKLNRLNNHMLRLGLRPFEMVITARKVGEHPELTPR